jgi:hypothetical protein
VSWNSCAPQHNTIEIVAHAATAARSGNRSCKIVTKYAPRLVDIPHRSNK